MGNRLEGKVAVVTGAGRGVGRGVALLMAEEGAKVVVNDLGAEVDGTGSSHEPADGVVAEIRARGGEASANYDNIALMDGGEAFIQPAVDKYGQVELLECLSKGLRMQQRRGTHILPYFVPGFKEDHDYAGAMACRISWKIM